MSHYLTQPEEVDYVLMTEKYETDTDTSISGGTHIRNIGALAGAVCDTHSTPRMNNWRDVSLSFTE